MIVDFVCLECRVVIELDGGQHNDDPTRDAKRDAALAALGLLVLRFWNPQLMDQREEVLDRIWRACVERRPAS